MIVLPTVHLDSSLQVEDRQLWQPSLTKNDQAYAPVPGRVMSAFAATSRLGTPALVFEAHS